MVITVLLRSYCNWSIFSGWVTFVAIYLLLYFVVVLVALFIFVIYCVVFFWLQQGGVCGVQGEVEQEVWQDRLHVQM